MSNRNPEEEPKKIHVKVASTVANTVSNAANTALDVARDLAFWRAATAIAAGITAANLISPDNKESSPTVMPTPQIRVADEQDTQRIYSGKPVHSLIDGGKAIITLKSGDKHTVTHPILTPDGEVLEKARKIPHVIKSYAEDGDGSKPKGNAEAIIYTQHGKELTQNEALEAATVAPVSLGYLGILSISEGPDKGAVAGLDLPQGSALYRALVSLPATPRD